METSLQDWVKILISRLISEKSELKIERTDDEQGVLLTVKVAKKDTGKILGKQGSIANAIRTLVRSAGYLEDMRVSVKIDAPNSNFALSSEDRG